MSGDDPKPAAGDPAAATSGRILSAGMDLYVKDCYSGDRPPCRCACPLDLDVVALVARVQKGRFGSAYTAYRDKVLFPAVVCRVCEQPCLQACVRKDLDESIALRKLERAIVDHAPSAAPTKYSIPAKDQTVAVVGAGLCGLSSTLKLASHGYRVTLLERSGRLGGRLWDLLPPGEFLPELANQLQHLDHEVRLGSEAGDLDALRAGHDAVLIATGEGGESFGLAGELDLATLGTARDGVFVAGSLLGGGPLGSIEQGVRAATSIENYLKTARMHVMQGLEPPAPSRLRVLLDGVAPAAGVEAEVYDAGEAVAEALRCLKCDCTRCFDACDFMQSYDKLPRRIVSDVRVTLNSVDQLTPKVATRLIGSCSVCGLCESVCTEHIDMGRFLLDARRIMHREGALAPVFHDFWMRDLAFSQGEQAYVARNAPGHETSDVLFFPGCQMGASDPAYVEAAYAYLRERHPRTGLILGCCGVPAEWAGDEAAAAAVLERFREHWAAMGRPEVVLACPTCRREFAHRLPEVATTSLYHVLAEHGLPEGHAAGEGVVAVFDPCAARHDAGTQRSVRALLAAAGYVCEELPTAREAAQCCGNGGHIAVANPELMNDIATKRVEMSPLPYIAYCTNCRDIFAGCGKACRHILDVVFGLNDGSRPAPSLTARRDNRTRLRAALLTSVWNEAVPDVEHSATQIIVSPELTAKLDALLILEGDLVATIEHCEATGDRLVDPQKDCFIGHHKQGLITYWVEYRREGDAFRILNAYSHRLTIEGE